MAANDLITTAEAKTHENISSSANDTELGTFITSATTLIEARIGPVVIQSFTDYFYDLPSQRRLFLSRFPVVSVTSIVTASYGTTMNTYLTAAVQANLTRGEVGVLDGTYLSGDVTVVYTAGRVAATADVPVAIKTAAKITVAELWTTQRGASTGRPTFNEQGSTTEGPPAIADGGLPLLAERYLSPYLLPPAQA